MADGGTGCRASESASVLMMACRSLLRALAANRNGSQWPMSDMQDPFEPPFPPAPRAVSSSGCLVPLALLVVGVVLLVSLGWIPPEVSAGPRLGVLLGAAICAVAAIQVANDYMGNPWRKDAVALARVVKAPTGPPPTLLALPLGAIPVVGILIEYLFSAVGQRRNATKLLVLHAGEWLTVEMPAGNAWKYLHENLDIWVLVSTAKKVNLIENRAPRRFRCLEVPARLCQMLDELTPVEDRPAVEARKQEIYAMEAHPAAQVRPAL